MHDPTEGGLATARYELAEASGVGVVVQEEAVRVLPETEAVCAAGSLSPWGLLASGALLVAVAEGDCETALGALKTAGIPAARVGRMVKPWAGRGGARPENDSGPLAKRRSRRLGDVATKKPATIGQLRESGYKVLTVKQEMRRNLIERISRGHA